MVSNPHPDTPKAVLTPNIPAVPQTPVWLWEQRTEGAGEGTLEYSLELSEGAACGPSRAPDPPDASCCLPASQGGS